MGHKVKPISLRTGIVKEWQARWFPKKRNFKVALEEDVIIREAINEKISQAGVDSVTIERFDETPRITIRAAKPGIIIGRGGKGVEDLIKFIESRIGALRIDKTDKKTRKIKGLSLNVEELKRTEISAAVMAQNIARDIERRLPFRRLIKKSLDQILQYKEVEGAKIRLAGRLNGAEIARNESLAKGKIPLTTLRANIDYGEATAFTTYGTIGIKVWINKGEIFIKNAQSGKL